MTKAVDRKAHKSKKMVSIPAGEFLMGSNDFYPEERPVHRVSVDAVRIDEIRSPSPSSAAS